MLTQKQVTAILSSILAVIAGLTGVVESVGQTGYDQYGYNYTDRKFEGLYENADRDMTNNAGDQTRLKMEWNDLFNPIQPQISGAGAWVTNFQTGTYVSNDGKTYRWSYSVKILYTGQGSPLWGYFSKQQENYVDTGNSSPPKLKPPVLPSPGP